MHTTHWLVSGWLLAMGLAACGESTPKEPVDASSTSADATTESSDRPPDSATDAITEASDGSLDGSTDAREAASDASVCASCARTLEQACAGDGGVDCPPSLGSPDFFAWAQRQIGSSAGGVGLWGIPMCEGLARCPEVVTVVFGAGVDCAHELVFQASSGKLLAITNTCDGFLLGSCAAATECISTQCLPIGQKIEATPPSACPLLPTAAPRDGGERADA